MLACRDEILELAASIHAAEAELVAKLAEFDAGEGWVGSGVSSLSHWLTLTCGFTATEARARADLAARRGELPRLFAAFDSGSFSLGALKCAAKVATPANDAEVTRVALVATAPQASRTYAAFRTAVCAERRREDDLAQRDRQDGGGSGIGGSEGVDHSSSDEWLSPGADDVESSVPGDPDTWLRTWWDEYRYLRVDGRLDPTDGAALKALIDAIRHDAESKHRTGGDEVYPSAGEDPGRGSPDAAEDDPGRGSPDAARGDASGSGGSAGADNMSGFTRSRSRLSAIEAFSRLTRLAGDALVHRGVRGRWQDRFAVTVTIDAEVLLGLRDGCGTLDDGAPVDPAVVHDWLPAATLEGLIHHRGAPLYMGRKVRVANRQTRRALRIRDGGCAFPGCDCTEFVDAHHVNGWTRGALTNVDELVLLCRRHHRLLHRGEYTITMRDGPPRFHSDVLGTGLPPPTPLKGRRACDGAQRTAATPTKRSCEPLTHYAKDVLVALLFGTPEKRPQVIGALG